MAPDVPSCQEIIREVTEGFSKQNANDRSEVQVAKLFKVIPEPAKLDWRAKKNGGGDINADCPSKADKAIRESVSSVEVQTIREAH